MAITVQYGPIAAALGLAQKAGQGQGFNIQAQRDMQALQLQNQMQGTINSNNANLIQLAQARDEMNARLAAQQQNQQQDNIYKQAAMEMQQKQFTQNTANQNTDNQLAQQQFQQNQQTQQQALSDKQARDKWLAGLPQDQRDIVMSGGHIPNALDVQEADRRNKTAGIEAAYKKADLLKDQITLLTKQLDPLSGASDVERANATSRIKQATQDLSTTIDGINAATGSQRGAGANPAASPRPVGGMPSSVLPDAEKAKLLVALSQQMGLPPSDPRVIQAAVSNAPAYAQQLLRAQQNTQVQAGSQRLLQQSQQNQGVYDQGRIKDQRDRDYLDAVMAQQSQF